MKKMSPEYIEQPFDVHHRLFSFKKWLRKFIKDNNYKDNEIVLAAHKTIFKYFIAKEFK